MIFVVQHNTKTRIIYTGVVWLGLPAAIVLNYYLALIATGALQVLIGSLLATWTIRDMYTKHKTYPDKQKICCILPSPKLPLKVDITFKPTKAI